MDLEGRLLGNRYEIIENIGNGGMATVYKAKDHILNRYVAVKILRDEFTTDQEFIKRFSIEAQAAASITHANIVSIYDVGQEGNLYYIVMELIKGKTLKDIIIEEGGPLPWKWSTNIVIQIASALETAHKNNIIHRDIKPHNIIITEDGLAKVTDFGIAKAVSNSTITAFGSTMGSVHYFSPEHAKGGYTDAKSDIYSLGVVMYEMLTGVVPFEADTPVSVALKHIQEEPISPIQINPKIPSQLNSIILKAIRKDPELRYQNATEILNDLNRALKEPDGIFIDSLNNDATRVIPTLDNKKKNGDKSSKKTTFVKKHKTFALIIGLVLLFILSMALGFAVMNNTKVNDTLLPNLVGITEEEANNKITESKLVLGERKEEYNSDFEKGVVISQEPVFQENYKVKENTQISIVVSLGEEETVVPKVIGETQENAIKALEDAKLKVEIEEEESKKVEAGFVIKQDKEANTTVKAGDVVKITVSTGVKKVEVPSVIEENEADAKKTLEDLGLKVVTTTKEDYSKADGAVLEQSIDVGEEVEEGTTIRLVINKYSTQKTANLTIDLESLIGKENTKEKVVVDKLDEDGNAIINEVTGKKETIIEERDRYVEVRITVDDEQVYPLKGKEKVLATDTIMQPATGTGRIIVKIYIDGTRYNTTAINLNETDKLTIDTRN